MVQAVNEDHKRDVYEWTKAYEHKDKCTAIDAFDPIIVLGINPSKGFVCPLSRDSSNRTGEVSLFLLLIYLFSSDYVGIRRRRVRD